MQLADVTWRRFFLPFLPLSAETFFKSFTSEILNDNVATKRVRESNKEDWNPRRQNQCKFWNVLNDECSFCAKFMAKADSIHNANFACVRHQTLKQLYRASRKNRAIGRLVLLFNEIELIFVPQGAKPFIGKTKAHSTDCCKKEWK